ncbi:hypothetical protein LZ30DRAFT_23871 [Colletotrichum cereale]|nr:hypothetical protein LZ30DRAFT_23871 [Colletotrichum cereale]
MIHSRSMAVAASCQVLAAGHRVEAVFGSRSGAGQSAGEEPTACHPGTRDHAGHVVSMQRRNVSRYGVLRYLLGKVRKYLQKLADTGCNPALSARSLVLANATRLLRVDRRATIFLRT